MTVIPPPAEGSAGKKRSIRILVVDDSAVIRAVISRTLSSQPDMEIVGSAINGDMAVRSVARLQPDIVVLDIEMPVMDGITAIPLILKEKPDAKIVMCSTLSARGAEVSIRALSLGATECILKPGGESITSAQDFQKSLVDLIRSLCGKLTASPARSDVKPDLRKFSLRPHTQIIPPRIVAIGSSTGGPRALMDVLKDMAGMPVPIVITQHMPKTFTAILAQHIEQNCKLPCFEGAEGMEVKAGCAYVAPGGLHMLFRAGANNKVTIHLDDGPPESYCKPSVNPMLRSLVSIYGAKILSVILTGMGSDGLAGGRAVVEAGGQVIAQDEASSVVWGMPGAVAMAGICSSVLPLSDVATAIRRTVEGRPTTAGLRP